jgi:hypothetical protein
MIQSLLRHKLAKVSVAVAVGGILVGGAIASPASAAVTTPAGYSFDGNAHVIIGGGSDTTWKAMISLQDLWLGAPGCDNTAPNPLALPLTLGACTVGSATNTLGNWDHDTISQAMPEGSSAGIASLNQAVSGTAGATCYSGTVSASAPPPAADGGASAANPTPCSGTSTAPNVDFARSSRAAKTTGGHCAGGNELTCDTFWGFARDGVEVTLFNDRIGQCSGAGALAQADLVKIWNRTYTTWGQVPGCTVPDPTSPIVAWGMNTASGTQATFAGFLGINPSTTGVDQGLTVNQFPFENDIKPIVNDVIANGMVAPNASGPGLSNAAGAVNNPHNWIWWGSFGVFSAFPYTSDYTGINSGGITEVKIANNQPVNGIVPSGRSIFTLNNYPIGRTLYHVTRKADADCPKTAGACDFTGNPGPGIGSGATTCQNGATFASCDVRVDSGAGVTGGTSGAVLEFTRFLCRSVAGQYPLDPFTGNNYVTEVSGALGANGFFGVPNALKTGGTNCSVTS